MAKEIPEHKDKLGRPIGLGDAVCYPVSNGLYIGTVIKINQKMIKVQKLGNSRWNNEHNKYPDDIIKLDQSEVTFYALKNIS